MVALMHRRLLYIYYAKLQKTIQNLLVGPARLTAAATTSSVGLTGIHIIRSATVQTETNKTRTRRVALLVAALLGGCQPVKVGVVPVPNPYGQGEVLVAHKVELVAPLENGGYVALSGDWRCNVEVAPLDVREGDMLVCRWYRTR